MIKKNLQHLALFIFFVSYFFIPLGAWLRTETVSVFAAPDVYGPSPEPTPVVEPTERDQIIDYIKEVFKEDSEGGLLMLRTCENSKLDPEAINWNGNGTWDYGLWMINEVHGYTREELSDPYFNTDVAYKIYQSGGDSFYYWTCGYVAGDETYLN